MPLKDIGDIEIVRRNRGSMVMSHDVTEGPMRWKRAMDWAKTHPTSKAALLFKSRTETANYVSARYSTDRVFRLTVGHHPPRKRYLCSVECTALQLQLTLARARGDSGLTGDDILGTLMWSADAPQLFNNGYATLEQLDPHALDASVKCRVCGLAIRADKTEVKKIVAATEAVTTYVLIAGRFVPVAELRVVDLTDDTRALLAEYSTPELRQRYVDDHGRRFDA